MDVKLLVWKKTKVRLHYNGYFSDGCDMKCSLLQGSCISPLLYSVFTNDLPYVISNSLVMYADDYTMFNSSNECSGLTIVYYSQFC